jgi:NADH-quinone oxidoreductase subunit L
MMANFLAPVLSQAGHHEEVDASLELTLMAVSVAMAIAGIVLAWFVYVRRKDVPGPDAEIDQSPIRRVIYHKLYIDEIYAALIVKPINFLSRFLHVVVDFLIIDLVVQGLARAVQLSGRGLRYVQSGGIHMYLFIMVVSIAMLLFFAFNFYALPV